MFGKLKDLMPNNRKYYLNINENAVNSQMKQQEREALKKKILNGQESGVPQINNNLEGAFMSAQS